MKPCIIFLVVLFQCARAATLEENLAIIGSAERGIIAFCTPSLVDELQIIGVPRQLTTSEARQLGGLLGAESTFFERNTNGELVGGYSACIVHWDFKVLLSSKDGQHIATIRLCSGCRQVDACVDGQPVRLPDVRGPAMTDLAKHFDAWFPRWRTKTKKNSLEWSERRRAYWDQSAR